MSVVVISYFLNVDFRFWIVQLKPMSPLQVRIALRYLIPFALFYIMFAVVLHGQMRLSSGSLTKKMIVSMLVSSLGYLVLLLLLYVPLLGGGKLSVPDVRMTLYAIIAIPILPLFIIVSLISTYFYEKTGFVYVGAFINAMFITWFIVAAQSTVFAL